MYQLVSEDLTHLGGRMGTEYTTTNFRKFFTTAGKAKLAAEKDYGQKIKWIAEGSGFRSPDLFYVMYRIKIVKVEG